MSVNKRARGWHRTASIVASMLLVLYATAVAATIPASERTVLLNLYTSTNGAGWTTNTNWNGAAGTECTWYGVFCDAGGNTVTQVILADNHLTGSLPALGGLPNLQYFWVYNNQPTGSNQLTGSIPALTGLTNLIGFEAANNQFTGTIPALSGLTSLQKFSVWGNQLTGSIPALSGLTSLQIFWATSNQLTGAIPTLSSLTNLQDFRVNINQLTGTIPVLSGLANLRDFTVSNNHLTGSIPTLSGLTSLQHFSVGFNQLTGSIPALSGLTGLQLFWANDNQLSGSLPALSGLTNLQDFRAFGNQLTGSIPTLSGLANLQHFDVAANQLTGSIPALSGLTNLRQFSTWSNQLTGSIPVLSGLTNLGGVYVHHNQLTGSIPALSGLTNLQYFYVDSNQLTGSIPALSGLTNLQYFHVDSNQLTGNVPSVPSPSALAAGGSGLCPNALNHTADAAWDVATGVTPWYTNCAAPVSPPSVITSAATNVTATTATLNGTVSSNGANTMVTFWYYTTGFGSFVTAAQSPLGAGATNAAVSAGVAGLACGTLYHFYASGANSAGTTNGADATFTPPCTLTPPSACTLTANPTSLATGGGTISLAVSCAAGSPPTSYNWSASPAVAYTGGGTTTVPINSAVIAQTTAFSVFANNAAGTSTAATASVQVAAVSAPPSGCTASVSPTSLASAGGTVQLNANCTSPGSGVIYSWRKNGTPFSTAQNPTDTLPANAAATAVTYAYQATACLAASPQTCTVIATISVTVAAASASTGPGTIISNPYGALTVQGGTLVGNSITNLQSNAVIQLGSTPGAAGSYVQIDFQGLAVGAGNTLTVRSGAPGQAVVINVGGVAPLAGILQTQGGNADPARVRPLVNSGLSSILGQLQMQGGNGALPPELELSNPSGITVEASGSIQAPSGLTLSTLSANSLNVGEPLVNNGTINGGGSLLLTAGNISGGGLFKGNAFTLSTFGNSNNPVNGAHFLANSLNFEPASGGVVALTLNHYGGAPQFFNLQVIGDAVVSMPSAGLAGLPSNNPPVPIGSSRPPGVPEPGYGGGSLIVQATGALTLDGGASNDFVFPGGIVLKAGGTLNVNDVFLNQGWTTAGQAFQGVFLESPNIVSPSSIRVYSNDLNWVNFSTLPKAPVRAFTLVHNSNGSASFATADATAPHVNTYSVLIDAAANNQCWTCLVNTQPVNMFGP